ncbi:MAG: flagellar basal-body rod protein FlgB [Firmicutes bacterium ZCTH02-B6]|nr:MAG: flagellar basal-body rod protein FlgB [Firmicutes bacterium ZCTH02-B6]
MRGFVQLDEVLRQALNAVALRQQVTAHNIANVNTPGFRRQSVQFEEQLQRARRRAAVSGATTHPRHLPIGTQAQPAPRVVTDSATVMRNDGNNVDIEREMAVLAAAETQYAALTQVVAARYRMLRSAISQGGR